MAMITINLLQYLYCMDFNQQITVLKHSIRMSYPKRNTNVRFISSEKWRGLMIRCLQKMKKKEIYDSNLLDDLTLIVSSIQEQKFVEAILNIQPFKPKFQLGHRKQNNQKHKKHVNNIEEYDELKTRTKLQRDQLLHSKSSIIKFKHSVHQRLNETWAEQKEEKYKRSLLDQIISMVTEEVTLTKQFQAKYHPFRKLIEQFLFLIENKYKNMIDSVETIEIQSVQESLIVDLKMIQEFIIKSSQPYLAIFKSENSEQKQLFQLKMVAFIKQYVQKNQKINLSIRKIMRMTARKTPIIQKLSHHLPDFIEITDFQIHQTFKIDGCYIQSMNALIQFAQSLSSKGSLKKLKQFRKSLGLDVDQYYKGEIVTSGNRQISTDTQIQILKFIISKLKSFICEIYAQLRYLQVVYGQDDMSCKYDDSSFMYAQLSLAICALQLDFP